MCLIDVTARCDSLCWIVILCRVYTYASCAQCIRGIILKMTLKRIDLFNNEYLLFYKLILLKL